MTFSSEDIKKDIVEHLFWDARLDGSEITVDITDNTVILKGLAPTHLARNVAEQNARAVPGVKAVRNEIDVRFPDGHRLPSDEEIQINIKQILSWDSDIDDSDILISVQNGNVIIDGSVPAYWQKIRVEEHAGDINGVKSVHSRLTVVPEKHYVDEMISRDIAAAFDRNSSISVDKIEIAVNNGHVILSGNVSTPQISIAAENIAKNTDGVIDVKNNIIS